MKAFFLKPVLTLYVTLCHKEAIVYKDSGTYIRMRFLGIGPRHDVKVIR